MNRKYLKKSQVPKGWMSRIRLARAANVSRATVKHYIDLGLLLDPVQTAPNMAYYDPACVERIALVRELQAERHLPLQVIAEMLRSQGPEEIERAFALNRALQADLLDILQGGDAQPVSRDALLSVEGITPEVLEGLEQIGLVRPTKKGSGSYDPVSLQVARAVGVMRGQGLTEESGFAVKDLAVYREKLQALVEAEAKLFGSRVLGRQGGKKTADLMRAALGGANALVLAIRARILADLLGRAE